MPSLDDCSAEGRRRRTTRSWTGHGRHARTHAMLVPMSMLSAFALPRRTAHNPRTAPTESQASKVQSKNRKKQSKKKHSILAPQEPQSRNRKSRKDLQTAQGRPSKKRRDGHRRIARTDSEEPQGQRTTTITMTHHDHHTHPQPNSMRSGASAQLSVHPQLPNSR